MSNRASEVRFPALLFAVAVAGCSSPSPCERFAELTRSCDAHEKPATTLAICRNACDRVGEDGHGSVAGEARARPVRRINATLRLQAACMADASTCDDYARCRELRTPR